MNAAPASGPRTPAPLRVLSVGEAMLELAPVGESLYRQGYAGDTFNTIWHLHHLLGPRAQAAFVTNVGTDSLSDRFVAELAVDGLDPSTITRDPTRTMGLYLIELLAAERSFHYWRAHAAARHLADDPARLDAAFRGATLIHLSGITLAILATPARDTLFAALAKARIQGARVSFDPNVRPRLWASPDETRAVFARMIPLTDIALPSFDDEATLWGDASPADTLARYRADGVEEIAVKDGANAVHHADGVEIGVLETPAAREVRDTTGAGDSFNAAYLAARLLGHSQPASIAAGQRLASDVLATPGAKASRAAVTDLAGAL